MVFELIALTCSAILKIKELVMSLQLLKNSLMTSVLLLFVVLVYTPSSYAKSVYNAKNTGYSAVATIAARPISGRNRRVVASRSYRNLYPQALNDQIKVSARVNKLRINVLSNDTGNRLRIKDVNKQSAKGGRIHLQGKHVVYSPRQNFRGWDSFWYAVVDANGHRHSAKVNVCVCSI